MTIRTNQGHVALASAAHVYANKDTLASDQQLSDWAHATRLISLRPSGLTKGRQQLLHAAGSKLLSYTKTLATADGSLQEHIYSHTQHAVRKGDPNWGVWICDPKGDWKLVHLAELRGDLYQGADGCFSDSGGDYPYSQGGKPYRSPTYQDVIPVAEWRSDTAALLAYWQKGDGRAIHCVNGLNPNSLPIYPAMIGMVENAFGSQASAGLPTLLTWQQHARLVWDAQVKGWTPWVFCKMHTQDVGTWARWRTYMAATMLLLDRGSLLFELGGMEGTDPPYINREYARPEYHPALGAPKLTAKDYEEYKQSDGTYLRPFTHGAVRVDPVHQTCHVGG